MIRMSDINFTFLTQFYQIFKCFSKTFSTTEPDDLGETGWLKEGFTDFQLTKPSQVKLLSGIETPTRGR